MEFFILTIALITAWLSLGMVSQIKELKAELEKENLLLKGEPLSKWMRSEIIGASQSIIYAMLKAKQVAQTSGAVLLEGETGVGKELFATLIQKKSLRDTLPFVIVNCGALPVELIEDELFGHKRTDLLSNINTAWRTV